MGRQRRRRTRIDEFLSDIDGNNSSKRLITFMGFVLIAAGFFLDLFIELDIEEFIFDGLVGIVMVGMGSSAVEHFSRKEERGYGHRDRDRGRGRRPRGRSTPADEEGQEPIDENQG